MAGSDSNAPSGPRRGALDPTNIDLTDFDLDRILRGAANTTEQVGARMIDLTREATYVAVGLGVLGFQRAQVRRRELERRFR